MNHTEEDQSKILSGLKELSLEEMDSEDLEIIDEGETSEAKAHTDSRIGE